MALGGAEAGPRAAIIHRKLHLHWRGCGRHARHVGQRTRLRLQEPERHGVPILEPRPRPRPRLQAESLVILTLGATNCLLCRLQLRGGLPQQQRSGKRRPIVLTA